MKKAKPVRNRNRSHRKSTVKKKGARNLFLQIRPAWLVQVFVILCCCSAAYILWLDFRIHSEFEGKRWSLPARVYARPLEIFPGMDLSLESLVEELKKTGYVLASNPSAAGEYSVTANRLNMIKRHFMFWDGREKEQQLEFVFAGNRLRAIKESATGSSISLVRIEPRIIGKIYPSHNEDRVLIPHEQTPQYLIDALVAVEDRHYYRHRGLDFRGIARAFLVNIRKAGITEGGSTLTQQLVKNFFLTRERTLSRKINEMVMSVLLERRYSKAEILSAYINEIFLGQHGARAIHGFGTAAEFYYARPLEELRLDQVAMLVALVRGASYYNPRRNPARALERRNLVIRLMQEQGYISRAAAVEATGRTLDLATKPTWSKAQYPAFLDLVKRQLLQAYRMEDLQSEGLKIFTTLNPDIQISMQERGLGKLLELEKLKPDITGSLQLAVVILRIDTGEVVAILGGRNENVLGFNRAVDAHRPIGSLIKPVIYLTALSQPEKYNLLSIINDSPVSLRQENNEFWRPKNFDGVSHGQVTMLEALVNSYNQAAVNLGMEVGLEQVITNIKNMGVVSKTHHLPSMLLGALELSPLEVAQLYQTLANGGFQVPLSTIREVLDKNGKPLQRTEIIIARGIEPPAATLTNFLLTQVVSIGTARGLKHRLRNSLPLAGKTGTTNEQRDSWFAGFGGNYLGVVWLGRDDNKSTRFTGASGAMQIWTDVMQGIKLDSLKLISPEVVEWTGQLEIPFSGTCIKLDTVPYITGFRPATGQACNAVGKRGN